MSDRSCSRVLEDFVSIVRGIHTEDFISVHQPLFAGSER